MPAIVTVIAKLSRIDEQLARRAWLSAGEADSVENAIPPEFTTGKGARVYALAFVLRHYPLQCGIGTFGLLLFAFYLIGQLAFQVNV
ncbi:hypothetical protein [Paraburkholderia domus]|uniref:hypothetical protein n=1 Tax=Paraburkholderia domus TaxID=2793075 RepID=UPI0019137DCF|nr:hypothetical protein [Paraburkholderia domus]MBK5065777.1 hypothetical protein [Burkholderia sp. R-70199]CAE6963001.1 hypothetical protein R70199_07464 [Paraburkholderia domus]